MWIIKYSKPAASHTLDTVNRSNFISVGNDGSKGKYPVKISWSNKDSCIIHKAQKNSENSNLTANASYVNIHPRLQRKKGHRWPNYHSESSLCKKYEKERSLAYRPPWLTPRARACAMPNLGAFLLHSGLKWSDRQMKPPRYIFAVLPSNEGIAISGGASGYAAGISNSKANWYRSCANMCQHWPCHLVPSGFDWISTQSESFCLFILIYSIKTFSSSRKRVSHCSPSRGPARVFSTGMRVSVFFVASSTILHYKTKSTVKYCWFYHWLTIWSRWPGVNSLASVSAKNSQVVTRIRHSH